MASVRLEKLAKMFDPATIDDRTTYTEPTREPAGIGSAPARYSSPKPGERVARKTDKNGEARGVERDANLGRRIREFRTERGLTLAGLASRVGVTRSFLSSVERGIAYPSIMVLRAIAAALEVPVFLLFTGRESNGVVVRRNQRKMIRQPNAPYSYELISPDVQHRMEMIIMRLKPGADPAPRAHEGEECALVLKGHVMLTIGGIDYELSEGDSIYYNSGLPHRARVIGDTEAEVVSAITPPSF